MIEQILIGDFTIEYTFAYREIDIRIAPVIKQVEWRILGVEKAYKKSKKEEEGVYDLVFFTCLVSDNRV